MDKIKLQNYALLEMSAASQNSSATDHLVPKKESKTLTDLDSATAPKKRRVNFNLTIDIKQVAHCCDLQSFLMKVRVDSLHGSRIAK